ncbi:MlaC/ttg2D family ABC transporter substrate-binding protein [Campylobacter pinnipediorum]|uniref:MlaC/ttg2D family ABC transporter substrate-binding protein n=1 Tax=Campylobacter pinnipediorum TaxID=1965231 RepID=UPI00084D7B94|nr:ABC transporter substrate-binding protein [Campylobacter pinnipediorum]AQW82948.1 lipid asymmetry ABC transporter MlaABCDEF, periplasmic component MlaC [Campylobacter pinnipediorum subsp. pinnipediorum]AQW84573.1 lipid asymmetry ABC transporter MlaABCDEF, periplasmic component MlaC [Campylobacter pinnipediorum subsp. pinnipediorum]OPA78215.1 toluene tolerance protein [Campylobacter pinnipediorum subsp. pinnipediorum]
MKFLKFILVLMFTMTFAFSIEKNEIKDVVTKKMDNALAVLSNKSLDEDERLKLVFAEFDPIFDYEQMAKISLGRNYKALSKEQQKEFAKAFEHNLKDNYIDKIKNYAGQDVFLKDAVEPQPNRYFLKGEVIDGGKVYDFTYKFYNAKERGWLVYDIDIVGISIIQTYRSQFADMLENTDFSVLMKKLHKSNEN